MKNMILWASLRFLRAIYPLEKGRGRLVGHPLVGSFIAFLPAVVRSKSVMGVPVWHYRDDFIGRMILVWGDLDRRMTGLLKRTLRTGDVFIDAGANIGLYTGTAAKIVGDAGNVISFEPNPKVFELLQRNCAEWKWATIQIFNEGLSNRSGEARLIVPEGNFGDAALEGNAAGSGLVEQVVLRTLDAQLPNLPSGPVVLKIDVQGHEPEVLEGAVSLFDTGRVRSVIFECVPDPGVGFLARREVKFLLERGYRIFEVEPTWTGLLRMRQLQGAPRASGFDFVALAPEK